MIEGVSDLLEGRDTDENSLDDFDGRQEAKQRYHVIHMMEGDVDQHIFHSQRNEKIGISIVGSSPQKIRKEGKSFNKKTNK